MAVVTEEEADQVEIFKYMLAQGVKEELVERILDWPGVHCFGALLEGTPMTGHWFDRSQEHAARVRGEEYSRFEYATTETVVLSPIPCWAHLPSEVYRARVAGLVERIETEAALARNLQG